MNKKVIRGLATGLIMLTSVGVAFGAGTKFEIKATMDSGIKVMYKGEAQQLKDVNGVTKDPIVYKDSVYIPIRSAAEIFGVNVNWDQDSQSVLLEDNVTLSLENDSLETIMEAVYSRVAKDERPVALYNTVITDENSNYFLGLKSLKGAKGLASESLMRPMAHSICLLRVPDGTDVNAVKKEIKENVDPYKWVCAGVDREKIVVDNIGNLIILIIDEHNSTKYHNNFSKLDINYQGGNDNSQDGNNPGTGESLGNMEMNKEGIYAVNDNYFKSLVLDENSVLKAANYMNNIQNKYLTKDNKVYYAVIPDKTYYDNLSSYEKLDYDKMTNILNTNIKNMEYIELKDLLELEDYYRTDNHWKQENLIDVANRLGEKLGFKINANDFEKNTFTQFKGMYSKYIISSNKIEELQYLTNKHINNAKVDNYQNKDFTSVYNTERLNSDIPYDVYLSGVSPFMTITNPSANNDKELVIFRDSFASSLAPLMISEYSKITLIDTRFMSSLLLKDFIQFTNQDILFLYSTAIVNNSNMLK